MLVKARSHARLGLFRTKKKNHTMKTDLQKNLSTSYGVKTPLDGNEENISATLSEGQSASAGIWQELNLA